jgi:hypothetical protein
VRIPLHPLQALRHHLSPYLHETRRSEWDQGSTRRMDTTGKETLPATTEADHCWIFGSGRCGSTWLLELLGGLNGVYAWHEPYFGLILRALQHTPDHPDAFFGGSHRAVWVEGIRKLFLQVAEAHFGVLPPGAKLIIKDINAPELCPYFTEIFPQARYLLLLRDPFDILDSYIDMQRPGSWNESFGAQTFGPELNSARIEGTARHIRKVYEMAVAGYDSVPPSLRLQVRYEDLLADTVEHLSRCTAFLGLAVSARQLQQRVEACRFDRHADTGKYSLRRFGKAGIWQTSGNFTPEVTQIAMETLGELRQRLGYAGQPKAVP